MIFDYTLIDHPPVRLTLAESEGGWYSVVDQTGQLYFPPTRDPEVCGRFMLAMAAKKDAVLDEESIVRATWSEHWRGRAYSVRAGALSETGERESGRQTTSPRADSGTDPSPLGPGPVSESVPDGRSNVVPIKKEIA